MKKFLKVITAVVLAAVIAVSVYLIGIQRPRLVAEKQVEYEQYMEELRAAERAEAERLAAIEAARDHRSYSIVNLSSGNSKVDNAIQSRIDQAAERFIENTENKEEERLSVVTRCYDDGEYFSVLMTSSYDREQKIETFFVNASNGKIQTPAQVFGKEWRAYLSDYFQANVGRISQIRLNLTASYDEYITDEDGNFERFVVLPDGTVDVYFDARTITADNQLRIVNIPNNVLTGEYYQRRRVDPNRPMVALTFDDGPSEDYSPRILDALEANGAVATFFEVGVNVERYPEQTHRAAELGCEIGSHTYRHINLPSAGQGLLDEDRRLCEEAFLNAMGDVPALMRPPEGAIGGTAKFYYDYPYIGWSVDTLDWSVRNTSRVVNTVKNFGNLDGQVILMHSTYDTSAAAAEILIPWLLEQGYQLVTISELLEFHYGIPVPEPHVYYAVDFFLYGREPY